MRVLITGGTGFIGSRLAEELRRREHEAIALGRKDGDLSEAGVAEGLLERHEPNLVAHLAARVGRIAGEQDPVETARQNAGAAALVARACAAHSVRLAFGSTSEVYGNHGEPPSTEDDPLIALPESMYGLSKRWGEEATLLYCPDAALLRFTGPYGPGTAPGRGRGAIQTMLDQARTGERVPAFRGIERSWCWIGDAVRGAVVILEHGEGGAWNIGRDDAHQSMAEAARIACRVAGAHEDLVDEVDPPAGLAARHLISAAKLQGLGWKPEVGLEEGMRRTLEWLRRG